MSYKTRPHGTRRGTIEDKALELIREMEGDAGILRAIRNAFPGCRTTLNCIRWYRCAFKGGYLWRA